jgi:hypothetical protein
MGGRDSEGVAVCAFHEHKKDHAMQMHTLQAAKTM